MGNNNHINSDADYQNIIQHIRYSLAELCVKGEISSFSLYRFLNRVSLGISESICYLICQQDKEQEDLLYIDRHSVTDPVFQKQFDIAINLYRHQEKRNSICLNKAKDVLIQILGTQFYIIVFEVSMSSKGQFELHDDEFKPVEVKTDIGKYFLECFKPFDIPIINYDLNDHIGKRFEDLPSIDEIIPASMDSPDVNWLSNIDKGKEEKYLKNAYDLACSLISKELDTLLESPLLKGGHISNSIVFMKCFTRQNVRFGEYYYNLIPVISSSQKESIVAALKNIKKGSFRKFSNLEIDRWFWDTIGSDNPFDIFRFLERPLSAHVRLFNEYPMMSGCILCSPYTIESANYGVFDSFYNSGKLSNEQENDKKNEYKRFVVLYYIFELMKPIGYNADLALFTYPVRVSGATWLTVTRILPTDRTRITSVASYNEFQHNFLFCHSLIYDFEKRVRRKSKQAYLSEVGKNFTKQLEESYDSRSRTVKNPLIQVDDQKIQLLTTRSGNIARIFPYEPIYFFPEALGKEIANEQNYQLAYLQGKHQIYIVMEPANPFFDRLTLRPFLRINEVCDTLEDMIDGKIGKIERQSWPYVVMGDESEQH